MTPLRSRLKDILRENISNVESGNTKEATSGRRKAAIESLVGHGVNNMSSQNSTFTLDESPPYSSEEEDNGDLISVTTKAKRDYAPYSTLHMSAPVDNLWPPKQTLPKSPFRSYNPSYRHVFLTPQPREESTTVMGDPEALKKRKITETEQTQAVRIAEQVKVSPKIPATPLPPPPQQSVKVPQQQQQPRVPMPRANYTFPRPISFPPGAVLRGGILHPPPGAGRSLILPLRPPYPAFIPTIPTPSTVESISSSTETEQTPTNSENEGTS